MNTINIKKNNKRKLVEKYRNHNYCKNIFIKSIEVRMNHKQYKSVKVKLVEDIRNMEIGDHKYY